MENLLEELGIPKRYFKSTSREDKFIALVHKSWLKSLVKHSKLSEFTEKTKLEAWGELDEDIGIGWTKIFVRVFKKRDVKVIPLPRTRASETNEAPLLFPQLLQYVSMTNYKNLWKEAYKKYNCNLESTKDTQVTLTDYNEVLREIICRTYGCTIINAISSSIANQVPSYEPHMNLLPAACSVETLNAIFLIHIPFLPHTLNDCITFSPAILDKCYTKPLFIIYQLLHSLKSLHNKSLTLGDITLNDIYVTEDLWIHIFPQLLSNLHVQDVHKYDINKKTVNIIDCRKFGHSFDSNLKCTSCGARTYDKLQVTNESLEQLCHLWIEGQISNFTYISALNKLSGRKLGDPHCHYVFPWVTDFASRCGKNWRDLKKSKYRLNKGDRQLDLTYEHSHAQVPHHVSDVLSPITYYVYMSRRTPQSVLCRNVRTIWVPAEYPSSIQRLQEWTPDECIPEFFTDPTVFKSIHDDLEDLEVPPWSSSPEDFVQQHREILESVYVSERLHHWIDLTFGYKLSGTAAVKAKNVCLHLVDDHAHLTKSGIVQLFAHPHPSKTNKSPFSGKLPPKIYVHKHKHRPTSRESRPSTSVEASKSEEEELSIDEDCTTPQLKTSPLALSRFLSRSRLSLAEEKEPKPSRSPSSGQRSTSLGPKTPTFTSHVTKSSNRLSIQKPCLSTGTIYLPKEYNPALNLANLENLHGFISKTFLSHQLSVSVSSKNSTRCTAKAEDHDDSYIQNAFTNRIFTEGFEARLYNQRAIKSYSFPIDNREQFTRVPNCKKNENQISCNYSAIITSRRIKELQILGCLIVELFMAKQLIALGNNALNLSFNDRLKACLAVTKMCKHEIPPCVRYILEILLPENSQSTTFQYPTVTNFGLPPPSAHLLLEPLLHCVVPFPKSFSKLYYLISSLKNFGSVSQELLVLYHFDCDGQMCLEYENLERTKILFAQNISECKVKRCAQNLEILLNNLNVNSDSEIVHILLPNIKDLLEEPSTSVLSAWYLFDMIARMLGTQKTSETLLTSMLKLYESEPNETTIPYNSKIAKLYHHSFLLRLMVRFGLKCFLEQFVTSLVEAVGGYRDYDRADFILHTHNKKILKKMSNLRSIDSEQSELSPSDDSSSCSDKNLPSSKTQPTAPVASEPEMFEFDQEDDRASDNGQSLQSLIEHLELNVASDLPFNHSTAEEALDATLTENIEQLRSLEELNLNINDDYLEGNCLSSTIPIPSYRPGELTNISCEIGSKRSETDYIYDKQSDPQHFEMSSPNTQASNFERIDRQSNSSGSVYNYSKSFMKFRKNEAKISDMSSDSLIWLSHRLGPVLTAKYLARNLLRMLTLCYVGKESLVSLPREGNECGSNEHVEPITIASSRVVGDQNATKVLDCLANIAALYGEQLILLQYFPHMSELIALCKKRLTPNLEGGLISSLALLQYIIPYLCDTTFMDHLQDVILKNILHPTVRLLGSTRYTFPNGALARNVLARKYVDTVYLLSLRMGAHMTKTHLAVPSLQRFFLIFDKANGDTSYTTEDVISKKNSTQRDHSPLRSIEETHFIEVRRDGTTAEWAVGGRPFQIRVKDSESVDSLSPPPFGKISTPSTADDIPNQALQELRTVFTSELAHTAYVPFLRQIGVDSLELSLKNHTVIKNLCQEYEHEIKLTYPNISSSWQLSDSHAYAASNSSGCNAAVVGNRIDVQGEASVDVLSLISNKMENTARHLRGNWLAYWEHEIGRSDKDTMFNFKQIRLQSFNGHLNSVKCLTVLDNENSFMSGSRDKTVKLWSLRSQGDGSSVSSCQWTYTAHRKSVLSLTFIESMRLVASSDSVVHIWDPYMGANVGHLESSKFPPVNVLKCMPAPSTILFAATTEGTVRVIDARICNYVYELKITVNPAGLIRCLAVSSSGLWLATGQSSGHITVLDTRTGLVISTWRAHESEVLQLVSHGENTLISSSLDQVISVWNIHEGRLKFHMRGATEPVHCLNIYNNELISGTTANRIGVHTSLHSDASFSSTKLRSDAFKGLLTSMAILPLNRLLLLGADNGNITLLC
ncbi:hypothetical protein PPYR_12844 [Photinus pyralis]|uniref:BEACH domain-containing protein n=1 Tax=Photinus pyralis TaxID=7054 RepID=A0A1Y1N077_PHOPY|nr:WD repeat-containing protein 81 isoform X2 [Photinus pyralis]KAB0793224.1 hypothetical protein PPYR_12844 [Photinus pyralis]